MRCPAQDLWGQGFQDSEAELNAAFFDYIGDSTYVNQGDLGSDLGSSWLRTRGLEAEKHVSEEWMKVVTCSGPKNDEKCLQLGSAIPP